MKLLKRMDVTFLATGPFFQAFSQADWLGKMIFLSLIALSIGSWTLIIHKILYTRLTQNQCHQFQEKFKQFRSRPLQIEIGSNTPRNPYLEIYQTLKKQTLDLLNKNRHFSQQRGDLSPSSYLSPTDIDFVESHVQTQISNQTQNLERNLYLLSTVATIAPFLGLLGTVWGILGSFSEMQTQASSNQVVLGGLALALTTTVLGLIIAIPALIGYNWLRNRIRSFHAQMADFSHELLACIELQYRQVDIHSCH